MKASGSSAKAKTRSNTKRAVVEGFLVVLAIILSVFALFNSRFPRDLPLTVHLQSLNSQTFLSLMRGVSFVFGGWLSILVFIVAALVAWWRIGRREAIMVLAGGLLTLTNSIFKLAVNCPRPSQQLVKVFSHEQGGSFPSGHALFAAVILGLVAYFCFVNLKNRTVKAWILAALVALALLVGVSRVYLGAHWPSDVLGGYLVGGVLVLALVWSFQVRLKHVNVQQP